MKQQTTVPSKTDKYYLKSGFGGYNPCILGNPKHRYCAGSVLVNCVGWVTGRFNAVIGKNKCTFLGNTNAENLLALAKKQGLEVGQTPRPGAAMIWAKGKVGVSSDGAGHTAFVEDVTTSTQVKTSESGWGYVNNYVTFRTRNKTAEWGLPGYTFLAFVYNPNVDPYHTASSTMRKGDKGEGVKWMQWALVKEKCYPINTKSQIDGSFGSGTVRALKAFQKKHGLEVDGHCGPKTRALIRKLYTLEGVY